MCAKSKQLRKWLIEFHVNVEGEWLEGSTMLANEKRPDLISVIPILSSLDASTHFVVPESQLACSYGRGAACGAYFARFSYLHVVGLCASL